MNPSAHQLTMTVLVTPDMANFAGNVHGGYILKFLDQAAHPYTSRYAARYVVTHSVDGVRVPIVLTSRADSARNREASAAVMVLLVHSRRKQPRRR